MFALENADDPHNVAEWVELTLALEEESLSKARVATAVEAASGLEPSENFLSDIWSHIEFRAQRYRESPIETVGNLARRSPNPAKPIYIALLLFSLYGKSELHRTDPKLFERIVAIAVARYLGGESYVFGWPPTGGAPAAIATRITQVASVLMERFVEDPGRQYKDRGVDVISWRPFLEPIAERRRSGQIVMLAQCAIGKGWRAKAPELPLAAWTQYLHWATDPIVGFAVPGVIPDAIWHDVAREVEGVVFDRIRLWNLLVEPIPDVALGGEIQVWVTGETEAAKAA